MHGSRIERIGVPQAVDLFCGCGSVSLATQHSDFQVVAAVDNDPVVCATYRKNLPEVNLFEADILELDPAELSKSVGKIDLLTVCAPCQPFSSKNRSRSPYNPESTLIHQGVRFAKELHPRVIFFENVAGILAPSFAPILRELFAGLRALGYAVSEPIRVDAADFGVPQRRVRCILLATLGEVAPNPDLEKLKMDRVTVRQAIGGLPRLESGQSSKDPLHRARMHSDLNLQRLRYIPQDGGDRFSLPEELVLECHKRGYKGHPDVYGRMKWDDVSPTLTTGCTDLTRGRFAHPTCDRAITLREAALLQSFPGDFSFAGNSSQIARQIGNAVPYKMALAFMQWCRESIRQ